MAVSFVQQVAGSALTGYGISTTAISSAAGNTLAAFIGWNCVTSGTYITVPSVSVSDSAGNLWQQIGISRAGGTEAASTRDAIWIAPNAQPVSWVSVGIAGFTSAASWTIAEISGLPQAVNLDFSISANGNGTAASLTGFPLHTDVGFALFSSGFGTTQTITGPGGWTALTHSSAGAGTTGTSLFPYWNPALAAGTAAVAGVFGTAAAYSYVLCGITASASPPAQFDNRFPLTVVEAAFGANPGAVFASLDYTFSSEYVPWTDISTRVIGDAAQGRITTSAGRQYELQQEEAGEMTIFLDNHDGAFTPSYPGSPYYSNALNQNMSFQVTTAPWQGFDGAQIALSTAFTMATGTGATAQYSLLLTPDGVTGFPGINYPGASTSTPLSVNPNYTYSQSGWVYCPVGWGTGVYGQITWYTSALVQISQTTGSTTAIPAGQWTFLSILNATPPSNAAFVTFSFVISGTPSAATLFYFAEAAFVQGPSAVKTGLVALETPIRVSTWWQGRRYPIWMGYVERWPQGWPELPQWGLSKVTATDALAVAAATTMNSALMGEVLLDNPFAYLPCNEQYTQASVGATPKFTFLFGTSPYFAPADASGLVALNRALDNSVTGTYLDGTSVQASTGLAMNFFGDNGTGMGATGYTTEVLGQRGPSMLYADPGIVNLLSSATGFTIEFWFTWDGTTAQNVMLLALYSTASSYWAGIGVNNGAFLSITITGGSLFVNIGRGTPYLVGTVTPSSNPQHVVLTMNTISGGTVVYLNGALPTSEGGIPAVTATPLTAIVLGPGQYSYDCNNSAIYDGFNYSAGHLAVYKYRLPLARIFSHYQAGSSGFAGTGAVQRVSQILTWGLLGLKRGGYTQEGALGHAELTAVGPAYQLGGSPASDAINSVAQAEGGRYFVKSDGTITYLERVIAYNQTAAVTLGDNATAAPDIANPNPGISQGGTGGHGWTSTGGAITYSGSFLYGQYGSLLFAPAATATTLYVASPPGPVTAGGTYSTGAWVYSLNPSGMTVTTGFAYTGGTAVAGTQFAAGSSWTYVTAQAAIPAGVTSASLTVSGGTGTANTFYISWGALSAVSPEVPYMQETEFDYDNTYLYNEVVATQIDGPNQLTVYDTRNVQSQQQYFRRSALQFQSQANSPYDVSDITTWSIAEFSQPVIHASAIKLNASANPLTVFPAALGLNIGDIVQMNRRPVGGAPISELGTIERIEYEIGSRYFYITYQVSPYAPSDNVLCADTAGFDQPGSTMLGW